MDAPSSSPPPGLPTWIRERDGRLVPFDGDRICQALFAATERLGRGDAFLARELTDGVLHFLAADCPASVIAADDLAETVAKVVRELRQPDAARAFLALDPAAAEPRREVVFRFSPLDAPAVVVRSCLRQYTLHAAFSRDVLAVHDAGLLLLPGLEEPLALAAFALAPPARPTAVPECAVLALDGPEHAADPLAAVRSPAPRRTIVNLNARPEPSWTEDGSCGPLFAAPPRASTADDGLDVLLDVLLPSASAGETLRIDWHMGGRDLSPRAEAGRQRRLLRVVRAALEGVPITFTFDAQRRPVALGAGLERGQPAVLLAVGLHLPRLADLPGVGSADALLGKLASLTRLALSAATQKRAWLRRQSREDDTAAELGRGFLLERARPLVVPVGLEEVVRRFHGRGICDGTVELGFACRIVEQLRASGAALLETAWDFALDGIGPAGLTPWDASVAPQAQLVAAGSLHAVAGGGTAAVHLPAGRPFGAEELIGLLRFAQTKTDVRGLRLVHPDRPQQPSLPGL